MKITSTSEIDSNGEQYISGLLEEEKFDERGLWNGIKAFSFDINHKKQTSIVCTFIWIGGAPRNYTVAKVYKNEILDVSEVESILTELNLI